MTCTERLCELYALTEVAKTLTLPLELPELFCAVIQKIVGVIEPAEVGVVMLWDQPSGLFRPAAAFGYDLDVLSELGLRAGESITGKVFDDGVGCLLNTPEQVAKAMEDMRPFNQEVMARALGSNVLPRCTLAAPIAVGAQTFGVLVLETIRGPAMFSEGDLPFLQTIADLIALAIDRDRLAAQADAVREGQRAERLRSEVLAMLSHELRMPLTAIQGYSSALLMDEVDWSEEKRLEFLHMIEDECNNMQTMLKDILDSSLIDVNQLILQRQPSRLPFIARDIAEEVQRRTESHRIITDFPMTFPILELDPRWIKQVFRNILDNAVKYSPEGGLIVIRGEERPCDVVIVVADQGTGISPENLIPLFERYFRVRSASNLHTPGTGLGLPIARAIIEAHGGRIWAESRLNEGTTIYFSLPKMTNTGS
ncbi:MAG: GAF domain-containing protein [Anaerolineales bacterium]|nr:GAF domain-containing protein [Anaerolineales bacterium]